ncbi:MAG: DALR domain-containing protein, partial [Patescibacteria group bacterium]
DLIFPHHEAEIAQQEAASGTKPFVKIWMHVGLLSIGGEKMSKSLDNFITIKDFLKKFPPEALRMIVLSRHYRSPLDYNEQLAENAEKNLKTIKEFLDKMEFIKNSKISEADASHRYGASKIQKYEKIFNAALANDFNTPEALATIFNFINDYQKNIRQINKKDAVEIANFIKEKMEIFGFKLKKEKIPLKISTLAQKREKLREFKQFIQADRLRKKIQGLGYIIEDTPYGPQITATRFRS